MRDSDRDCKTDQVKTQHETLPGKNPIVMNTKMLCAVSAIAIFAAGAAMAETAHELIERADGASEHADLLAETADAVALMSCVFDGVFVSAMAA